MVKFPAGAQVYKPDPVILGCHGKPVIGSRSVPHHGPGRVQWRKVGKMIPGRVTVVSWLLLTHLKIWVICRSSTSEMIGRFGLR